MLSCFILSSTGALCDNLFRLVEVITLVLVLQTKCASHPVIICSYETTRMNVSGQSEGR